MKSTIVPKLKMLLMLFSLALLSTNCGSDDPEPVVLTETDTDGDGVVDTDDSCVTLAGLAALNGCPDADSDGIADKDDTCPNEAGLSTLNGCPDTDSDGVADQDDTCPTEAGSSDASGCPDSDNDGVADQDDLCPNVAGLANLDGCPDADGDGITDLEDTCPEVAGIVSLNGCPDADGDGVTDLEDTCPNEAGVAALDGCPEVEDATESTVAVGPTLLRFNSGGGEVTIGNDTFLADQYFVGETEAYTNPLITEIGNTDLDEIYLTERITIESSGLGPFSYEIPVSNGTYTVKLYFAEIFWGVENPQNLDGGEGSRLFGIKIEEETIINSLDVFKAAGGAAKAFTKMYDVEVTDGEINIRFEATIDRPKVSAVEILGTGTINP